MDSQKRCHPERIGVILSEAKDLLFLPILLRNLRHLRIGLLFYTETMKVKVAVHEAIEACIVI